MLSVEKSGLERVIELIRNMGLEVELSQDLLDLKKSVAKVLEDFLLNVVLNPCVLTELFKLQSPKLVISPSYSTVLVWLQGRHRYQPIMIQGELSDEAVQLLLHSPVVMLLTPRMRILLGETYRNVTEGQPHSLLIEVDNVLKKDYFIFYWSKKLLREYLRRLALLREILPLLKAIRTATVMWASSRGLSLQPKEVTDFVLVDVARFPKSGDVVWKLRREKILF